MDHDESVEFVDRDDNKLSMFTLAPTLEDRATGFFVANYVLGMSGPSRGHLDYLANIARREVLDEGLLCSIKAVGLAGYSHSAHAPSLMKNARYQYMKALQSTNRALRDPESAKKDNTLISIMILTIFETITGCKQSSLKDWAQHVMGAAAVIKLRGPEQIKTQAGRKMMIQSTASLLIYCLQRGCHVPDHIYEYMKKIMELIPNPDPALVVNNTMMIFAGLRADVMNGKLTDRNEILRRALELDGILMNLESNTSLEGWTYESVYTDEVCDYVWKGRYHVYYDYWVAQIWNGLRVVRIMTNEMIRKVLLGGFTAIPPVFSQPEHTAQFQISTDTLYQLQTDVLYSVVQHVGHFPKPTERFQHKSVAAQKIIDLHEELADVRMSGGSFLLWPLYLVGIMDLADVEVQDFVVLNLKAIGDRMGIAQAHVLANIVKSRTDFQEFKEFKERSAEN
jgi:hypothetical protein